MNKPFRIILDTNLWISYLISNKFLTIDSLIKQGRIKLIFSEASLQEFIEVAGRPKFEKYFSPEDVEELLELFNYYGELATVTSVVEVCRDTKDNFLLALAKDSQADFLITGDKDLRELEQFTSTRILTFAEFEKIVKA